MIKNKKNNNPLILFLSKTSEPLFSKKNKALLSDPMDDNNPITVQVLGVCSALAITVQLKAAIVMTVSVIAVMAASNVIVSLLRDLIPNRIRIIVQLVVVASMVILVDQVLRAYAYDVSKELSIFIGLIITNCIVMGRLEAFALGNGVWRSFLDGVGNAAAYGFILILVAFVRELFGSGNLLGYQIIPDSFYEMGYENNGFMLLSPMALIIVGVIIWIQRSRNRKLIEKGAKLIGLGARDTLRLEAGLCLYGHELDKDKTPVEANLKWAISKERILKGDFIGSDIIIKQLNDGVQKVRVGIKPEGRIIAREKTKIFNQSNLHIGEITSGTFGPSVNGPVAMGYVENEFSKKDTKVFLEVRGKKHPANICGLPFYKKSYVKGAN